MQAMIDELAKQAEESLGNYQAAMDETLALVEAWELPQIIALLIRGTDSLRANIARMAVDTARDIVANNRHPSIPAQLVNLQRLIPAASHAQLLAPLPIADDYREEVLLAVSAESAPQGGRKPS